MAARVSSRTKSRRPFLRGGLRRVTSSVGGLLRCSTTSTRAKRRGPAKCPASGERRANAGAESEAEESQELENFRRALRTARPDFGDRARERRRCDRRAAKRWFATPTLRSTARRVRDEIACARSKTSRSERRKKARHEVMHAGSISVAHDAVAPRTCAMMWRIRRRAS